MRSDEESMTGKSTTGKRRTIPKAVRDAVLDEFGHKCAICGNERPQIHHIDTDPANNVLTNLIPLCPNHHLIDQHQPTRALDPRLLMLFREHKDPTVFKPQFIPLFKRMSFLDSLENYATTNDIYAEVEELIAFVSVLEMGSYYGTTIKVILSEPQHDAISFGGYEDPRETAQRERQYLETYRAHLGQVRSKVVGLCIELLRFQRW
jgi:hypothetical protein